ncbi:MAG TPA: histidinol dehydrogenase [Bacteroidales bacterium]|nr:histidinol dehydrogenase [Bacteroidales bacterium]
MEILILPDRDEWGTICNRPLMEKEGLEKAVGDIIAEVRNGSDKALKDLTGKFDGFRPENLRVTSSEIEEADLLVPEALKEAILTAKVNIEKFHTAQIKSESPVETTRGVTCWRKSVPIEKVGLYIPGGSAPLFSTLLMLGIPAKLAGCEQVVVCTPPDKKGKISPEILYTAGILGITDIFKAGGAQAVAAMAYGTESVPAVYKIFGPGNQYVTKAKEMVQQDGIAIDMPAGPSEVLIIADATADAGTVAADLISQAEHGKDSQVILLTNNRALAERVIEEIGLQAEQLPRKEIINGSLAHSRFVVLQALDDCIEFSNIYAPEHLIINTANAPSLGEKVKNAGSVFLGKYSCESAGDYASGTNHTLPTNGFARNYSGVSSDSFIKKITFQSVTEEGIRNLGPAIEVMASSESLEGHRNAVSLRLKKLEND